MNVRLIIGLNPSSRFQADRLNLAGRSLQHYYVPWDQFKRGGTITRHVHS
jgi:hypothetical protein